MYTRPAQDAYYEAAAPYKSVGTKVSEAEFALLEERARGAGMRLAEWVQDALLAAPVESGSDAAEVALGEILALRSLFLNLHFRAAKGDPVAESEVDGPSGVFGPLLQPHTALQGSFAAS